MIFSKSVALELAELCEAAYALAETGHCKLPDGFTGPIAIRMPAEHRPFFLQGDPLDIWGYATTKEGAGYIVFRGTQFTSGIKFLQEWAEDALSLPLAQYGSGKVHLGFYRAWRALQEATYHAVEVASGETSRRWIVTGHSLGAAIATLCSVTIGDLMTFASPRVGDADFAKGLWERKTVRVFNKPDHVPNVPTHPPFLHGGTPMEIDGPGDWAHPQTSHALSSIVSGLRELEGPIPLE